MKSPEKAVKSFSKPRGVGKGENMRLMSTFWCMHFLTCIIIFGLAFIFTFTLRKTEAQRWGQWLNHGPTRRQRLKTKAYCLQGLCFFRLISKARSGSFCIHSKTEDRRNPTRAGLGFFSFWRIPGCLIPVCHLTNIFEAASTGSLFILGSHWLLLSTLWPISVSERWTPSSASQGP